MVDQTEATDPASRLGRLEAADFDRHLRDRERQELEERWTRPFRYAEPTGADGAQAPRLDFHTQQQLERLTQYHIAVQSSRAWRVLQALRRPFGRQW